MAGSIWKAAAEIQEQLQYIQGKNHSPRLDDAAIAICFADSKPFLKDRFNWGKVSRFNNLSQLYQMQKFDFCICLSTDAWNLLENPAHKEALLDLNLSRCGVELIPETITENKKKVVVKDQWGRTKYTNEIKVDEDGNPKWRIEPFDLNVFAQNARRYGLWMADFIEDVDSLLEIKNE